MWILFSFLFICKCVYTYKWPFWALLFGVYLFFSCPPYPALLLLSVELSRYLILLSLWNVRLHKRIICMVGHESAPIRMKEIHSLIRFVSFFNLQNFYSSLFSIFLLIVIECPRIYCMHNLSINKKNCLLIIYVRISCVNSMCQNQTDFA